jgi:dolichol-phosphate mannosyltransferase
MTNIQKLINIKQQNAYKIVLIIPCYNEGRKLSTTLTDLQGELNRLKSRHIFSLIDKIMVVDDGSDDESVSIAKSYGVVVKSHRRRMDVGAAVRTGIDYALDNNFDIIVVQTATGKDRPEDIPSLLQPILEKDYDYVQGSRYVEGGISENMPFHRRLFNPIYNYSFRLLTKSKMYDATNGFRAYKTSIFNDKRINIWQYWLYSNMEYYLSVKVLQLGYKVKEVPVKKIYPPNVDYWKYTKVKPFWGWIDKIKPLFYLSLGVKN